MSNNVYREGVNSVVSGSNDSQFQNMIFKYIDGSVPDGSNSIANTLELLQSCTKSSILLW